MAEEEGGPGHSQGNSQGDGPWRSYYDQHPLTAATSAILNMDDTPPSTMSFICEYYTKFPQIGGDKEKLAELWPSGSSAAGAGTILSAGMKTSSLLNNQGPLEIGQSGLGDIPSLLLHHPQSHGAVVVATAAVKREPEDLSHRKNSSDKPRQKLLLVPSVHTELVVDVSHGNSPMVKDEYMESPQQGRRSINGTPSSTSSLIAHDPNSTIEVLSPDGVKSGITYGSHVIGMTSGGPGSPTPSPISYTDHGTQYATQTGTGCISTTGTIRSTPQASVSFSEPYYREYFTEQSPYVTQLRQVTAFDGADGIGGATSFVERYVRQSSYHNKGVIASAGLTVDLPSPDSGIGADAITPRDSAIQPSFDYAEMCQTPLLNETAHRSGSAHTPSPGPPSSTGRSRPWHDFGRQTDADKIQIPKIVSNYGFKYYLETPISTNQRREDDRVTYINKGQFYGITMEYTPEPDKTLKNVTVKSVVMLMFREEKSQEDEIKAWQFWHGRQHSVKQRILDADTKNSVGFVGCIEEIAHNAIAVYWNPLESSAKLNIAVQCLSTDFSSQKGVKGLPLHLQIDTYDDPRDGPVIHRGYCQIKVFCDKGAERKTRDEERRAAKRKMAASGRKKMEELYHPPCERSEFYSMADLTKPPVLFTPSEDLDKLNPMDLQGFYGHDTDASSLSNGESSSIKHSPFLLHAVTGKNLTSTTPTLKFHNHFPPDITSDKKEESSSPDANIFSNPPMKKPKFPPITERVMLYVRQENEEIYTPLHVVPPTTQGLLNAIESKYKISAASINNLYRKNSHGILAKIDEEMIAYYCNEDLFLLEVRPSEKNEDMFDVILEELCKT